MLLENTRGDYVDEMKLVVKIMRILSGSKNAIDFRNLGVRPILNDGAETVFLHKTFESLGIPITQEYIQKEVEAVGCAFLYPERSFGHELVPTQPYA